MCEGVAQARTSKCKGFILKHMKTICVPCRLEKNKLTRKTKTAKKIETLQVVKRYSCKKQIRLKNKVDRLKYNVTSLKTKCANKSEKEIERQIGNLPLSQQENVKACLAAAKVNNSKGRRYTTHWIYECFLIRIKSRNVYEHLRRHNILTLPSVDTLHKYINKIGSSYGFQMPLFEVLQKKALLMEPQERRGTLLIDEMKLSERLNFDTKKLEMVGFTFLGSYTEENKKNELGDHALVLMFQPFQGKWVQSLACFLSKGAASSSVLHHLIIECQIFM